MKNLIVFASKCGTTEEVAFCISKKLKTETDIFDCKNNKFYSAEGLQLDTAIDLKDYKLIIIGTPMYMGSPLKEIKQFCRKNEKQFIEKETVLFTCGIGSIDEDKAYIIKHIPPSIFNRSKYFHFGGKINLDKMNFFERFAMKKYEESHGPAKGIDQEQLSEFCNNINA